MLFDIINSRSAVSGPGNDGQRFFVHLQSITHTNFEREELGWVMTASWRRIADEPDALPPEVWQLLQSSLTHWGENTGPVRVGMVWKRRITAGAL